MKFSTARAIIGSVWLLGGLGFYALMIYQSSIGRYEPDTEKAWAWALPVIMPTLLLIVAVLASEAVQSKKGNVNDDKKVSVFFFCWTLILSVFYIVVVSFTALRPILVNDNSLILMERSQLWLGPFQGLVAGAFGVFYVDGKNKN